jgi:predicted transcriptional regulator
MLNVASNIRITPDANRLLTGLAQRLSRPKAQVIELALRQLDDRFLWADVQKAFSEEETPEMIAEREIWDRTSSDGIAAERW